MKDDSTPRPTATPTLEEEVGGTDVPLFWSSRFLACSPELAIWRYRLDDLGEFSIVFQRRGNQVSIPGLATFGGAWSPCVHQVSAEALRSIWQRFLKCFPQGCSVSIRLPPESFDPVFGNVHNNALSSLMDSSLTDLSQWIAVSQWGLTDMSSGNQKRRRALLRRGAICRELDPDEYARSYRLLAGNRSRRGVKLSIPLSKYLKLLEVLPEDYKCWGVVDVSGDLLAAALTVRWSSKCLYVLYWGDTPEGRARSAVALLAASLVEAAQSLGFEQLDLGVSSIDGMSNDGLARFKANLGAQPAFRTTWLLGTDDPARGLYCLSRQSRLEAM